MVFSVYAEQPPQCKPIQGTQELWARPGLRFVTVGEMHGTTETPAIFADLVCSAHETKRAVIVGIELQDQRSLEAAANSGKRSEVWKGQDGRTSSAMLALVDRLDALKAAGIVSDLVPFSVSRVGEAAAKGEERMASALLKVAQAHPDALVIALSGNVHACKNIVPEIAPYRLMASYLPPAQTVSLVVTDRGGQAWNCQNGACGPHTLDSSGGEKRAVTFGSPHRCFDGVLSTGLLATASMPAQ